MVRLLLALREVALCIRCTLLFGKGLVRYDLVLSPESSDETTRREPSLHKLLCLWITMRFPLPLQKKSLAFQRLMIPKPCF